MRVFIFILLLVGGGFAIYQLNFQPKPKTVVEQKDLWAGDQETGCMYPISKVSNGKDPIWWSTRQRQWNIFSSREEAAQAGYYNCEQ